MTAAFALPSKQTSLGRHRDADNVDVVEEAGEVSVRSDAVPASNFVGRGRVAAKDAGEPDDLTVSGGRAMHVAHPDASADETETWRGIVHC